MSQVLYTLILILGIWVDQLLEWTLSSEFKFLLFISKIFQEYQVDNITRIDIEPLFN